VTPAITAALVGVMEEQYRRSLVRVLGELGIRATDATDPGIPRPDIVLATVPFDHVESVLQVAAWVADGSPVLALLPSADESLARRASTSGAHASNVLAASIDTLKSTILRVLAERRNESSP
jgi:hypothetical protein